MTVTCSHRNRRCPILVLSRKKNESIVIDNHIKIVVVDIRGDKVRLGIEAPQNVPVHRQEVFDAIQRHNAESGFTDADHAADTVIIREGAACIA